MTIRVTAESEERVRGLVLCRETFQREFVTSQYYVLKILRRRILVGREGRNWTAKSDGWLRRPMRTEALSSEDGTVLEEFAFGDTCREAVERLRCFRGLTRIPRWCYSPSSATFVASRARGS